MAFLLGYAPYLGNFLTHSMSNQKLFFLTVLKLVAPLSSFFEEVLYKFLNEWMNEWSTHLLKPLVQQHTFRWTQWSWQPAARVLLQILYFHKYPILPRWLRIQTTIFLPGPSMFRSPPWSSISGVSVESGHFAFTDSAAPRESMKLQINPLKAHIHSMASRTSVNSFA